MRITHPVGPHVAEGLAAGEEKGEPHRPRAQGHFHSSRKRWHSEDLDLERVSRAQRRWNIESCLRERKTSTTCGDSGHVATADAAGDDQTLSDRDQTTSDQDQTKSDRDQTGSDSDRNSSAADQHASDLDLAAGGDPAVHEQSRLARAHAARCASRCRCCATSRRRTGSTRLRSVTLPGPRAIDGRTSRTTCGRTSFLHQSSFANPSHEAARDAARTPAHLPDLPAAT